jgi:hypothetical protein
VTMSDRIGGRPMQRGLPVPYLVPFWGEGPLVIDKISRTRTADGHWRVSFPDEQPSDRDAAGALWTRVASVEQPTIADMGKVHPHRQRDCMLTPRCQVCGDTLAADAVPWLVPLTETATDRPGGDRFLTATPPTCWSCATVARRLCPALRGAGSRLHTVRSCRPWGVIGMGTDIETLVAISMDKPPKPRWVGYHQTAQLDQVVAEQLIVELLEFDVVNDTVARP